MVLSDRTILNTIMGDHELIATDAFPDPVNIQPASYDLRLGRNFKVMKQAPSPICLKDDLGDIYEVIETDAITIRPHQFVLATTQEYVKLPNDITAFVEGRSSIGRLGLFVQNAGWVDPGFEGEITLELYNASPNGIVLDSGMRIAQLVFCKMDQAAEVPYKGKYQGQKGATSSAISKDYDIRNWGK